MPLAFIYLFLLIFNLEILTIYPLKLALAYIIKISNFIANLKFSNIDISLISTHSLIIIIFGFLWLCLWQKNWRYLGFIAIIIGLFLAFTTPLPNLIIDGKRQFFAIYNEEKGLFFSKKVRKSFRVKNLIKKMGQKDFKTIDKMKDEEIYCQYESCSAKINNQNILILTKRNKIDKICKAKYDILINMSKYQLPNCINSSKKIINNIELDKSGSQYLHF